MVKGRSKIEKGLLLIATFVFLFTPILVRAEGSRVFDEGDLFSQNEIEKLEKDANELSDTYAMDIVLVTTKDAQGKSSRDYADDYFDNNGFGVGETRDGILFLLDMDNREAYISTSGEGIKYITDFRREKILDAVFEGGLPEGEYYEAANAFLSQTGKYLQEGIPSNQHSQDEGEKEPNSLSFLEGVISLIVGALASTGFFFKTKSAYKTKNPPRPMTFRENSIVNIVSRDDTLLDTKVTHRAMPKPSSDSGKSTTHTSSSGRTHGGGGRKF